MAVLNRHYALLICMTSVAFGDNLMDNFVSEILYKTTPLPEMPTEGSWNPLSWLRSNFLDTSYDPDTDLSTLEIAIRHGYQAEAHVVKTSDGYLLTMHRIPCSRYGCQRNGGRGRGQPVFLQHGLLSSSADWVISGPGKALAYILADSGYDVWLGNARGNTYSRRHISMSNEDPKFWDFSWHEMAVYDIPAEIDYIYEIKAEEYYMNPPQGRSMSNDLIYIGHSMGTTMAFALLSSRPEYNDKILAAFALAPVAYMSHVKSPIRLLAPFSKDIQAIIKYLGGNEFLPQNKIIKFLAKFGCELTQVEKYICQNTVYVLCGFDKAQFNSTLMPVIFAHTPAGTSTKTVVHYAQEIHESGRFQHFDYGRSENIRRYGQESPPAYNLSNITTPFALFYAQNDWLAGPIDVENVYSKLQRTSMGMFKVPFDKFNHVDFLWGIDAPKLVYRKLLDLMHRFHWT